MITVSFRVVDALAAAALALGLLTAPPPQPLPAATGPSGPVVFVLGQSNASGYAAPYTGPGLPPGATLYRAGERVGAMPLLTTGIEDGLIDALGESGHPNPVVVVQATGGISLEGWLSSDLPALDRLSTSHGLVPDAIVWIHGETDAHTEASARRYLDAAFGAGPDSLVSRLRARWPGVPILVAELRVEDPRHGALSTMRAVQHWGCAQTDDCEVIRTAGFPLALDGLHYSSEGFYRLGAAVAARALARIETHP